MGIDFFTGEVDTQSNGVRTAFQPYIAGIEGLKKAIAKLALEPGKGATWDSAKNYYNTVYGTALDGMACMYETLIEDHKSFADRYKSEVDSGSLQEEILKTHIKEIETQIILLNMIKAKEPEQ